MSTTWYDTVPTLGFLAGVTQRVRLLSHVFVAAYRGDGWLPQGVPKEGMRSAIERIHELRAEAGQTDEPFTIGAFAVPGPPEKVAASLDAFATLGVDQVQVRFPSTSCADLCGQ